MESSVIAGEETESESEEELGTEEEEEQEEHVATEGRGESLTHNKLAYVESTTKAGEETETESEDEEDSENEKSQEEEKKVETHAVTEDGAKTDPQEDTSAVDVEEQNTDSEKSSRTMSRSESIYNLASKGKPTSARHKLLRERNANARTGLMNTLCQLARKTSTAILNGHHLSKSQTAAQDIADNLRLFKEDLSVIHKKMQLFLDLETECLPTIYNPCAVVDRDDLANLRQEIETHLQRQCETAKVIWIKDDRLRIGFDEGPLHSELIFLLRPVSASILSLPSSQQKSTHRGTEVIQLSRTVDPRHETLCQSVTQDLITFLKLQQQEREKSASLAALSETVEVEVVVDDGSGGGNTETVAQTTS